MQGVTFLHANTGHYTPIQNITRQYRTRKPHEGNHTVNTARAIIHVDMDAFFAAVEVRDNPDLAGKPLIIGALPHERGVVSTCSYEARKFGVHSAMSIKKAYRLCPNGIYMHPNMHKYKAASDKIHEIWSVYSDLVEYVSLDEGYLDVTGSAHLFGGAQQIGRSIKRKTIDQTGLTCSVGIGYSPMTAKLASEEDKPDGFFEIPDSQALKNLIIDRNVRVIYGVGERTASLLQDAGIRTVRDIYENKQRILAMLGNHGAQIIELAQGIDNRAVIAYADPKSIGKEHTFQNDITDFDYLRDVLLLIAKKLSFDIKRKGIYCQTVTLKITYADMKQITRSQTGPTTSKTEVIYQTAAAMLDRIDRRPIRLVGISLSNFAQEDMRQTSLFDKKADDAMDKLDDTLFQLQQKYSTDIIKTGSELVAERNIRGDD